MHHMVKHGTFKSVVHYELCCAVGFDFINPTVEISVHVAGGGQTQAFAGGGHTQALTRRENQRKYQRKRDGEREREREPISWREMLIRGEGGRGTERMDTERLMKVIV